MSSQGIADLIVSQILAYIEDELSLDGLRITWDKLPPDVQRETLAEWANIVKTTLAHHLPGMTSKVLSKPLTVAQMQQTAEGEHVEGIIPFTEDCGPGHCPDCSEQKTSEAVRAVSAGSMVVVPEPGPDDPWRRTFVGRVVSFKGDGKIVTVVYPDEEAWNVEADRLELLPPEMWGMGESEQRFLTWQRNRKMELRLRREKGEPVIQQLMENNEYHSLSTTMQHVRAWPQDIWVSEVLERHGFVWDGEQWTRTETAREWSMQYTQALRDHRERRDGVRYRTTQIYNR